MRRLAVPVRPRRGDTGEIAHVVQEILRAHDVALVVADSAGTWPYFEEDTAGFRYVRLHGADELYASGYTDEALEAWAAKVRGWLADGQDAFVYFDNDAKVHAPRDAIGLLELLGVA